MLSLIIHFIINYIYLLNIQLDNYKQLKFAHLNILT